MAETMTTNVPFLDLSLMHQPLKERVLAEIADLIDTNAFSNGPHVATFEASFADYCRVDHCVGLASGLDALRLGLQAAGVGPGDEVVVPAMTFVATAEAVVQAGATPVLADVREDDFCLDPEAARAAVTERTRFLMPVHLYGQMADMRGLGEVGVDIFEDACQAHGAERNGLRAGAEGKVAAFSFYPGKNLGAFGDAGALTTADAELATAVRALREHGQTRKYHHEYSGWTSRLDTIQALVLSAKLEELDRWNEERRAVAAWYADALAGLGDLKLPAVVAESSPVWHLYVVRTADPERLGTHLREHGVATGRHYPEPVHAAVPFRSLGKTGQFPVAEAVARECLSLPMFPGMTEAQVDAVATAIGMFFDG